MNFLTPDKLMITSNCYSQNRFPTFAELPTDLSLCQTVQHQIYDCPLYLWSAFGSIKLNKDQREERYFLYIEYRTHSRASSYVIREFVEWQDLMHFVDYQADSLVIRDISPKMTRHFQIASL
ncbi:hypothetical protein EOPP23_18590 [Endozoicomonas sp. OPT23]|uniref:hypothetical protein n=1 Tax=Endozoicomonas sp. OPT23 TaxID=2072845 RepID=UPI00129AF1FB|nr:hypothetical protein [Endozoicomonas sp. OPT23]MRI34987.1 hypothetical protein [Endozoicomonas sp. OPT23]